MSVHDVISKAGYSIDDKDVVVFLSDFAALNEHIKSLSRIRKGSVVRLPIRSLEKTRSTFFADREKTELRTVKQRIADRREAEKLEKEFRLRNRTLILKNITALTQALDEKISIDTAGVKLFSVSDRSELSLDAALFPMITVNKGRMVLFDVNGSLPTELKDLIETTWPEYRVVVNRSGYDLRSITGLILDSMGYAFSKDSKVILGAKTRIEYLADFSVYQQKENIFDSEILVIGIVGPQEFATPDKVLEWLRERGVRIVELAHSETKRYPESGGKALQFDVQSDPRKFTEGLISFLGYAATQGKRYDLSDGKGYRYTFRADLSIPWEKRVKIIDFFDLSDHEISYAEKKGFDVVCIRSWEEKRDITSKILSHLSLRHSSSPKTNASVLTPKGVKYRLHSPGIFVHSIQGPLFITDSDLDADILRRLISKDITLITL